MLNSTSYSLRTTSTILEASSDNTALEEPSMRVDNFL